MRAMRLHDDRTDATPRPQEARLRAGRHRTAQQRREAIVARNRPDPTRLRRTTSSRQHVATFAASRPAGSEWGRQQSEKGPVAPTTAISRVPTAANRGWVPNPASESIPVPEQKSGALSNQLGGTGHATIWRSVRHRGVRCRVLPPSNSRVPNHARCRRLPATRLSRTQSDVDYRRTSSARCRSRLRPVTNQPVPNSRSSPVPQQATMSGAPTDRGSGAPTGHYVRCPLLPAFLVPLATRCRNRLASY